MNGGEDPEKLISEDITPSRSGRKRWVENRVKVRSLGKGRGTGEKDGAV